MTSIVLLGLTLLLAGCLPLSMHPLWESEEDLVFEQKLLGRWDGNSSDLDLGIWSFSPMEGRGYQLTVTGEEGVPPAVFAAYLVPLGDHLLLDALLTDPGPEYKDASNPLAQFTLVPMHAFAAIEIHEDRLLLKTVDMERLAATLRGGNSPLPCRIDADDSGNPRVILAGSTEQVRAFLKDHLDEDGFFGDTVVLKRLPADEATESVRM